MTRLAKRFVVSVALLLATGVLAFYVYDPHTHINAAQPKEARKVVIGAADWVTFDAVQSQTLDSGRVVAGHFFQGFDGSTRMEAGYDLETPLVIDIKNVEQKRYYVRTSDGTWTSGPMFPPDPFKPPQFSVGGGLDAEPFPAKVKGFDVHRRQKTGKWQNDKGDVREGTITEYLAPVLNFFTVFSESTMGGRIEYNDIKLRPQPKELFAPPIGAKVIYTDELGGYVSAKEAKKAGIDYGAYLKEHNEKVHKGAHK